MTIEQKLFLMHRFHSQEECGGESPLEHPAPWMGGDLVGLRMMVVEEINFNLITIK